MACKSAQAFRTITEVSDWLDTPAHVLRFWESKFKQIKPIKRAGGRRYYRPEDLRVIGGIKTLLHGRGYTIAAVQDMLKHDPKTVETQSPEVAFKEKGKSEETAPVIPIRDKKPSADQTDLRDLYRQLSAIRDRMAQTLKDA